MKKGKHLGCAQAVDMSLEGIGLACTLGLKKGEVVEIDLPEEGRYGYARYLVVHAGHGRCGLMFSHCRIAANSSAADLLLDTVNLPNYNLSYIQPLLSGLSCKFETHNLENIK